MTLTAGTKLGPYEVVAPAGAGGIGEVYRAHDSRLNREVAIKVLPAAFSRDLERLRRFQQEAQAVAALNHPNILAIHDFGEHQGSPYIVMELLEGETLRLLSGAMPIRKLTGFAAQICLGLAAAHDKGIVHRDLKPENIFITRNGRVKVLDFGLAKVTHPEPVSPDAATLASQTEPGLVMGTVGYMSPEQVRGQVTDHRTRTLAGHRRSTERSQVGFVSSSISDRQVFAERNRRSRTAYRRAREKSRTSARHC